MILMCAETSLCACHSLPCVKQHKLQSGCSGVRDRTAFVALSRFSDLDLLSGDSSHFYTHTLFCNVHKTLAVTMSGSVLE